MDQAVGGMSLTICPFKESVDDDDYDDDNGIIIITFPQIPALSSWRAVLLPQRSPCNHKRLNIELSKPKSGLSRDETTITALLYSTELISTL